MATGTIEAIVSEFFELRAELLRQGFAQGEGDSTFSEDAINQAAAALMVVRELRWFIDRWEEKR
jgi:hypothetical protein